MGDRSPGSIVVPVEVVEHCASHARWAAPDEACGLVAVSERRVTFFYACTNLDRSPSRFTIDPVEHFRALQHAERHGWTIGGSFHSHPGGAGGPSSVDVARALDPEWLYLIWSEGRVRGFWIRAGVTSEARLTH